MKECSLHQHFHLVIGSIPVMARLGLTQLIVTFQKKYPKINVEIKERPNRDLLNLIKRRELDVAFITAPIEGTPKHPMIKYYTLMEDEIILVANKSKKLTQRVSLDLAEAKNEVFFLLDSDSGMYSFTPKIHESRNVETIMVQVAEGLGVTLLTDRLVRSFNNPNITMVRLNQPFKRITSLAVWNQPHLSFPVKKFIEHSLEWAALNA